ARADLAIVKYFVDRAGVDIEERDDDGRTPLSWAAERGDRGVVDYFLNVPADVNSRDHQGRTPLYWAAVANHKSNMRSLLDRDTDTLHIMAKEQPDLVKLLLEAGYDVCKRDSDKCIPLHYAASAGNIESVKLLISDKTESVNYEDIAGRTPLKIAVTQSPHIVKTLVEALAMTDGIEPSAWFSGNENDQAEIVCLSKEGKKQSLHFTSSNQLLQELAEHSSTFGPSRRLFLCKDSPPLWRHGNFLGFKIPQTDDNLQCKLQPGGPPNNTLQKICCFLATSFPTSALSWCMKPSELLDIQELIISWIIYQRPANNIGWSSEPANYLSALECSAIPEDGAQFCMQFFDVLESRWTRVLKGVENHMRKRRRMDFGKTPPGSVPLDEWNGLGLSTNLIEKLQRDLSNLANLRDILSNHVEEAQFFIDKYCRLHNHGRGEKQAREKITRLELRGISDLDRSEQMLRDLLTFEFARVSVNEARRSVAIANSMKRLT
ncbi:Ankyrin repeat domain-containing 50, partial [Fusarium albosuccineum]